MQPVQVQRHSFQFRCAFGRRRRLQAVAANAVERFDATRRFAQDSRVLRHQAVGSCRAARLHRFAFPHPQATPMRLADPKSAWLVAFTAGHTEQDVTPNAAQVLGAHALQIPQRARATEAPKPDRLDAIPGDARPTLLWFVAIQQIVTLSIDRHEVDPLVITQL